jgi:hypothetical protein
MRAYKESREEALNTVAWHAVSQQFDKDEQDEKSGKWKPRGHSVRRSLGAGRCAQVYGGAVTAKKGEERRQSRGSRALGSVP